MSSNKRSFRLWPIPEEGKPYGPTPKQKLLFIDHLSEKDKPHNHNVDVVLYIGGARSGKTLAATARVIQFLIDNPGSVAIIGAENRPLLWRSSVKVWQDRFTNVTPWDHLKLPNRLITRKPTMTEPRIDFTNGSVAHFLHFSDPEILKGIDADLINFEEADLLKDEGTFEELLARLSGKKGPIRQLILTTNPVNASRGWIKDKFKLWQLKPGYNKEIEPIVKPCLCQFCQPCLNAGYGQWEFMDEDGNPCTKKGSVCSNPNCKKIEIMRQFDPNSTTAERKDNNCPGDQSFYRVIQTASTDNLHIPSDYAQSALRGMSAETAAAMVHGQITENTDGRVYSAFSDDNILKVSEPIDFSKDILWSLDFNYDPQCSVVCQETETQDGYKLTVVDEIVKWNSLPEHVAKEFCKRYHKFKFTDREILLYSDPAGLWGGGSDLKPTFYKTIVDYLTKPTNEHGDHDPDGAAFKVKVMMRIDKKPYSDKTRERVKIYVSEKVDSTNALLKNAEGEIRLFVNPHCKYLITSLEGVEWAPDGQSIYTKVDAYAKQKSKDIIRVMTHPSDSLGYLCAKRFPLLKAKKGFILMQSPGSSSTVITAGRIEDRLRDEASKRMDEKKKEKQEEREKKRAERLLEKEEKRLKKERSLGSVIDTMRKSPFGFFYF